jgi:hypothetical protein
MKVGLKSFLGNVEERRFNRRDMATLEEGL